MKYLFAPITPFVGHPERAAIMAAVFLLAVAAIWFLRRRFEWLVFTAALGWSLFAAWEGYCKSAGYNIRVDLFLIYPVLLALTLTAVLAAFFPGMATRSTTRQFSLRSLMVLVTLVALALAMLVWLAS